MTEDDIQGRLMMAISSVVHNSPARVDLMMERLAKHGIVFEARIHDELILTLPDNLTDEQMLVIIAELKLG